VRVLKGLRTRDETAWSQRMTNARHGKLLDMVSRLVSTLGMANVLLVSTLDIVIFK